LDGRNSSERPPDFFELAAEVYNDPGFNPVTNKYPSLHSDFSDHIILWAKNAPKVSPQKIREKWSDVRGKLVIIVKKYEQSGNGEGNKLANDADHGPVLSIHIN
jgi:hypothetical protein